ncbi:cell division protein FtsQ/DivIB [Streptomyces sp. GC420]|uniref:cell division protein FtsQ/DivIB n=1 Tax=Streptomyces sp. GC420 TaxID=2697568 RepID=UPI00141510FE|nr:FtsQ-type POTRA domain-containing protein [Streptomyces sp. GC420]NBM21123.1 FtsQ-type POTRA domain-containing protein [Streptomyces sp. GC420]
MPGRRARILLPLAGVLLTGPVLWLLYGSSWLRVERVSVSGTEVLTAAQVREAAGVPMGEQLISVDLEAVETRLRGKLRRIDSVEAERSWPRGIILEVTERKPELLIEKGGKFIEVDAEGVRFATVATAPRGVPLLVMAASRSPSLRRFGTERLTREAVRVASALPDRIARSTRTVKISSYDAVSLDLTGGRTVVWGSPESGAAKARVLLALMKAEPEAGYFDVSAPTAPAVAGS